MKVKVGKMKKSRDRIPDEVLKEIFPKKLKRSLTSELVYSQLKQMILSGKLKKGQKLFQDKIAQDFNVSKIAVTIAYSRLKKEKLIISKGKTGSFVA
jgi:DNA-binding GntR family transcriptional regulator